MVRLRFLSQNDRFWSASWALKLVFRKHICVLCKVGVGEQLHCLLPARARRLKIIMRIPRHIKTDNIYLSVEIFDAKRSALFVRPCRLAAQHLWQQAAELAVQPRSGCRGLVKKSPLILRFAKLWLIAIPGTSTKEHCSVIVLWKNWEDGVGIQVNRTESSLSSQHPWFII